MSDYALPTRGSPERNIAVLRDLIHRFDRTGKPVHFDQAAIDVHRTTASSILSYFNKIGLIEKEGSGEYVPKQAIIDYLNDGNAKRGEIIQILSDDEVYDEVQYLKDRGIEDISQLAETAADQLEIDDGGEKVRRAIGIFDELNVLTLDEDLPDSSQSSEDDNESGAAESVDVPMSEGSGINWSSISPGDFQTPPARASPDYLKQVCELFAERGGTLSEDDIEEDTEVPSKNISDSLNYGRQLDFIEESEDGFEATEEGYSLGLGNDTESLIWNGLCGHKLYLIIIYGTGLKENTHEENAIDRDTVYTLLRTKLGFTDVSEDNLSRKISTLLKTIEAAGYGEFKQGTPGHPTRVELPQDSDLFSKVEAALQEEHGIGSQPESIESDEDGSTEEEDLGEGGMGQQSHENGDSESSSAEISRPASGPKRIGTVESDREVQASLENIQSGSQAERIGSERTVTLEINVDLDLAEIDSEDLKKKLTHIDEFLSGGESEPEVK